MNHRARKLHASLAVAAITLALMLVLVVALSGCGRSEKADTQFAPTKPLVGYFTFAGDSMLPTLPNQGVSAVDVAFPFESLMQGDVVVYWDYKREIFTQHRLAVKQGRAWIARGDNNTEHDAPFVTSSNFLGKVLLP